ncbi:helix-turn-helix domain-containing protein [Streptomyces sp. NPDC055400]
MQVLDRAVALIEAAAGGGGSAGELARVAGVSRSTAFRLLNALVRQDMLRRDDSGVYRLGGRAFQLGALADQELLLGLAARAVDLLHAATGESVHVYRRVGDARECVAGADKLSGLRRVVRVGHVEEACGDAVDVVLDARHGARRAPPAQGPG